jgi:hypothetical protein
VIESDDFAQNTKLEILDLSENFITELPADVFTPLTNLKALYFLFNYVREIPATLFSTNTELELLSFVDNQLTGFEPGTFDGLKKAKLLAFGQQGKAEDKAKNFDSTGIPDGLFDDLESLEYLSSFFMNIGVLKEKWFGPWSAKLEAVVVFLYGSGQAGPLLIEDGVFDKLPSLIDIASYTSGNVINPTDVANNSKLKTVLYGSQFDILAPLPEPDLYNAALI